MEHHDSRHALKIALCLTTVILIVECVGGMLSGSVSLLGDAGHMLQDSVAIGLSLAAMLIAQRTPTPLRTFGYHRVEIAAAGISGIILLAVSILIMQNALSRLSSPAPVDSGIMLPVAFTGLAANILAAAALHGHDDLNVRSAFWHVIGDLLSSVAVIVAGIWIAFTGQTIIDLLAGIFIACVILFSAFSILRESLGIFLQFTPRSLDTGTIVQDILEVPGVRGIHNVHAWSLCSNIPVFDAHIYCTATDAPTVESVRKAVRDRLKRHGIRESTLEFEFQECADCALYRRLKD